MRYIEVSHMCIFPSDGTSRIRFTGQGYKALSQPDASGSPKIDLFCGSSTLYLKNCKCQVKKIPKAPLCKGSWQKSLIFD